MNLPEETLIRRRVREEEDDGEEESEEEEVPERKTSHSPEWEEMASAWMSAFPVARPVTPAEVETWIDSNFESLPTDLLSIPRADLVDRLLSIQGYLRPTQPPQQLELAATLSNVEVGEEDEDAIHGGDHLHNARFQRTDRWLPVYTWLESLDINEPVKSKDISDWLARNPDVGERLCSRHSKYHLFHYIKKCHMKILKRRGKKGFHLSDSHTSPKLQKGGDTNDLMAFLGHPLKDIPKDSELYTMKRNEALEKYNILLALERTLAPHFSKHPQ